MKKALVLLLGLVLVGCYNTASKEEAATEETPAVEVEVIENGAAAVDAVVVPAETGEETVE